MKITSFKIMSKMNGKKTITHILATMVLSFSPFAAMKYVPNTAVAAAKRNGKLNNPYLLPLYVTQTVPNTLARANHETHIPIPLAGNLA